jgi:hypothetical protein
MKKELVPETCHFRSTQTEVSDITGPAPQEKMGPMYNCFGFNHEPEESMRLRSLKYSFTGRSADPIVVGALHRKCSGQE